MLRRYIQQWLTKRFVNLFHLYFRSVIDRHRFRFRNRKRQFTHAFHHLTHKRAHMRSHSNCQKESFCMNPCVRAEFFSSFRSTCSVRSLALFFFSLCSSLVICSASFRTVVETVILSFGAHLWRKTSECEAMETHTHTHTHSQCAHRRNDRAKCSDRSFRKVRLKLKLLWPH